MFSMTICRTVSPPRRSSENSITCIIPALHIQSQYLKPNERRSFNARACFPTHKTFANNVTLISHRGRTFDPGNFAQNVNKPSRTASIIVCKHQKPSITEYTLLELNPSVVPFRDAISTLRRQEETPIVRRGNILAL